MIQRLRTWLLAAKDSFVTLLPLTFFGVAAVLVLHLPWDAYQEGMTALFGPSWQANMGRVVDATHGVFAVTLAAAVAVHLTRRLAPLQQVTENDAVLTAGLSALINLILFSNAGTASAHPYGHQLMLPALAIGVASAELLRLLSRVRLLALPQLPYDTEPAFYHAMRLSLPVMLSGLIVLIVAHFFAYHPLHAEHLLAPLADWAHAGEGGIWWTSLAATLINQAFWFLGIHGGHVLDSFAADLFLPAGASYDGSRPWRPLFDSFVLLGGTGATLGLLVAIAIGVKEGPQRRIGLISIFPAFFNVNESLVYGLPMVLNPVFLLPFFLAPLLLSLQAVAAVEWGWIELQVAELPWTTPPLISGWLLTGSWRGVALQVSGIVISALVYLPFVRRAEAQRLQVQNAIFTHATEVILDEEHTRIPAVCRQDQVGLIARGLLADLRKDMARGALELHYQPKHDREGRVEGVEALLRWTHGRHGPISPAVAVNLAEGGNDIHALGIWVFDAACACKARWNSKGLGALVTGVNVSPAQLTDPSFPDHIERILHKHGLRPAEIELEITESSVLPKTDTVDDTLRRLSAIGVRLAMDDFGMGYSSLLYLRRFQVHAIKVDGSLTRDVLTNGTNADIIRTIANLGQTQKVDVVVEFVETQEQRDKLEELGCNVFQGYYHSRPLNEDACLAYFWHHQANAKAPPVATGD